MGVDVKITSNIKEISRDLEQSRLKKMIKAVSTVRNNTMETLSGNRSGRTYHVPGTSRTYTASSPGEPPAQATGRLRQSVKYKVEHGGKTGHVGTGLDYGASLEYGTSKIKPRPWLKPSFSKSEREVKQILGERWL